MKFPWQKRPINQAPAIDGDALGALAEYHRWSAQQSAFHNQLRSAYGQASAGFIQPPIVEIPEDHPASEVFKIIEENTVYGKAFKRIMRDVNTELEVKDKRIRDLESQLETAGELWTQNYSN